MKKARFGRLGHPDRELGPSRQRMRTSRCWICKRHEDEAALVTPLLSYLKTTNKVQGCSRQCEELQIRSAIILAHFYRLECSHYCASHIDHRCCECRAKESLPKRPETAIRQ